MKFFCETYMKQQSLEFDKLTIAQFVTILIVLVKPVSFVDTYNLLYIKYNIHTKLLENIV